MSEFIISTDSTCDLPKTFLEDNRILIHPLHYTTGDSHYRDGSDTDFHAFYESMRKGTVYQTASTCPEGIEKRFRTALDAGYDILHIGFSSGLSCTYNNTRLAVTELSDEYPDRTIRTVDSLSASLGQGLLVYYACKMKREGASLADTVAWLEANKLHLCHQFTVDDLRYLMRGGRIGKATSIIGTLINVKPVLHMDNEGHLVSLSNVRGRKKAMLTMIDNMAASLGHYENDVIFISHADCIDEARFLGEQITARFGIQNIVYNSIGAAIGSHCGPGTIALFYLGENR